MVGSGAGDPAAAVAGAVDAAIDGEVWVAAVDITAIDRAACDPAGAAPAVVGSAGGVTFIGGEGAVEIGGGKHEHIVPHADGIHRVFEGADSAGGLVDETLMALDGVTLSL